MHRANLFGSPISRFDDFRQRLIQLSKEEPDKYEYLNFHRCNQDSLIFKWNISGYNELCNFIDVSSPVLKEHFTSQNYAEEDRHIFERYEKLNADHWYIPEITTPEHEYICIGYDICCKKCKEKNRMPLLNRGRSWNFRSANKLAEEASELLSKMCIMDESYSGIIGYSSRSIIIRIFRYGICMKCAKKLHLNRYAAVPLCAFFTTLSSVSDTAFNYSEPNIIKNILSMIKHTNDVLDVEHSTNNDAVISRIHPSV